jgi:hypothetical protein
MNQVVSEQCVEILQAAVNKFQEAGEKYTQHALLLVNSKLLSLYSKYRKYFMLFLLIVCTFVVNILN